MGGSGVMENSIYPRLFRESVINPIWEGSGNVQCLDVLRAVGKTPAVLEAFHRELSLAKGANKHFDTALAHLEKQLAALKTTDLMDIEYLARHLVDQMAVTFQAGLLVRHAPASVADAFCASRLAVQGTHNYGVLPKGADVRQIIERANISDKSGLVKSASSVQA
ncbi:MAG: acyl-CoA dehydrogenase family protein [Limnobacter sp.]|nr:acyl-CoA dehydrogenase family protein [Limnobacter sp.]